MMIVATPAIAATTITTSAYALASTIKVANTVGVTVGPLAATAGQASPGYTDNNSVVSLNTNVDLGVVSLVRAGIGLNTGLLTSTSTANGVLPSDTTNGSGQSQVNDLVVDLFTRFSVLPPLTTLGLTADTITSKTTVSRLGNSALLTGQSVFENLNLQLVSLLNFGLGANAQVMPNTVLINALGIKITLNEQIVGGNGTTMQSLTTNAINISLNDYLVGGRLLRGNLIIGNSFAAINIDDPIIPPVSGVPEPAVWLQLITGFGLTGVLLRRRTRVVA